MNSPVGTVHEKLCTPVYDDLGVNRCTTVGFLEESTRLPRGVLEESTTLENKEPHVRRRGVLWTVDQRERCLIRAVSS